MGSAMRDDGSKKKRKLAQIDGASEDKSTDLSDKAARKAAKKAAKLAAKAAEEAAAEPAVTAQSDDEDQAAKDKAARKAAKKAKKEAKKAAVAAKGGDDGGSGGDSGSADAAYREEMGISVKLSGADGEDEEVEAPACVRSLDDAPFDEAVIKAMKKSGFTIPSPIQAQGWPIAVKGKDLIAVAKTGSGKTLGYLLPAFERLKKAGKKGAGNMPGVLVLAPTRELANQIQVECTKFGSVQGVSSCCIYGGVPLGPQKAELAAGRQVVIATPGRLCDLMKQGCVSLASCGLVVLDEADRMLDMGFEPQIKEIFAALPGATDRQTLFFTATWPKAVRKMARAFLGAEAMQVFIAAGDDGELEANKAVSQEFVESTDDEKDAKLWKLLQALPEGARVVCFANTKRRVDYLQKGLWEEGLGTCSIHGDKQQADRDKSLRQFASGELPLLFATDVAARGLDLPGVTHVINFDMARDVETYVHRIGRTGRAGASGKSVTFWNPDYDKECTPALIRIAKEAGQPVPEWLMKHAGAKVSKQWKVEDAAKLMAASASA
jgi:ATP-dependent RNA helicase DDX5/DBP2